MFMFQLPDVFFQVHLEFCDQERSGCWQVDSVTALKSLYQLNFKLSRSQGLIMADFDKLLKQSESIY